MKKLPWLAICLLPVVVAKGESSSSGDIPKDELKQMIEQLESVRNGAESRKTKLINAGIAALSSAAASESEAMKLYEQCFKKTEFDDKGKKDKEWREWKTSYKSAIASPANRKILCIQIQWTLLMLKAGLEPDEKYDARKYAAQGIALMKEILNDPKLLKDSLSPFDNSIVNGPIGTVFELEACKRDRWPDDIMDFHNVINQLLLEPCRKKNDFDELRKNWNISIGLQKTKQELEKKYRDPSFYGGLRFGSADVSDDSDQMYCYDQSAENMAWYREIDCFRCGDKAKAARNMLAMVKVEKSPKLQERYAKVLDVLLKEDMSDRKLKINMINNGEGFYIEKQSEGGD